MSETASLTGPLRKMYAQMGLLCFRMQSGRIQKGHSWIYLCDEGTADLLVFPHRKPPTWIETKDPAGTTKKARQEAQGAFQARVESLGHVYAKVRTIDEGLEAVR